MDVTSNVKRFKIPESFLPHFLDSQVPHRVREFAAIVLDRVITKQRAPIQSRVVRKVLGERHYKAFTDLMERCEGVERDETYVPRYFGGNNARCKAYFLSKPCHHIVGVRVGFSVRRLLFRALSKFSFDGVSLDVSALFLGSVSLPRLSLDDFGRLCGDKDPESVCDAYFSTADKLSKGLFRPRLCGDGRSYHPLTCLPKAIRARCFVDGEKMVGVDGHALHPAIMAHVFAAGKERRELIAMLQTGDFYTAMGKRLGISRADVKKNFLANCLYAFDSKERIWALFKRAFPITATRLANFRDRGEIVFDGWAYEDGKKFRKRTRFGQRALSRLFCRIEGDIFRGAQKQLYAQHGIATAPLHDSLLCKASDAETVRTVIEQWLYRVLGFDLPTKFE